MSRGLLSKSIRKEIDRSLPESGDLRSLALGLSPDFIAVKFDPKTTIPLASVAFQDCTGTLAEIRYALFEYFAHGQYYRQAKRATDEYTAVFFERYYLDDAALRLYAAGEQLAAAVVLMSEISKADLAPHRKKRKSEQAVLGEYLAKKKDGAALTAALLALARSNDWKFAANYRNRWVHDQPPTLAGRGLIYRRGARWKISADGTKRFLALRTGDQPEYAVATVARHMLSAHEKLIAAVRTAFGAYLEILKAKGIQRTTSGFSVTL